MDTVQEDIKQFMKQNKISLWQGVRYCRQCGRRYIVSSYAKEGGYDAETGSQLDDFRLIAHTGCPEHIYESRMFVWDKKHSIWGRAKLFGLIPIF